MLRKLKWQIPGEPLAARYNWCQGPVRGRGPAVEKHCSTSFIFWTLFLNTQNILNTPTLLTSSNKLNTWTTYTSEKKTPLHCANLKTLNFFNPLQNTTVAYYTAKTCCKTWKPHQKIRHFFVIRQFVKYAYIFTLLSTKNVFFNAEFNVMF